jgi:prepilin-type processing-associated H-X9-DG protein
MRTRTDVRRRGFTMFELIVILALLAVLLGLLLPIVQRVREAASRISCTNNLHQIMIAVHNYQTTNDTLPPAVGLSLDQKMEGTILFHILPCLEEKEGLESLYKDSTDDAGLQCAWNGSAASRSVKLFLCPSDSTGGRDHLYEGWLATSSYAANYLVFGDTPRKLATITDGLSNTMGLTERYQVCKNLPCAWAYSGEMEWAPVFAFSSQGKFQMMPRQGECDPALAQTAHRNGIQVAMCDGSVRTIAPTFRAEDWYHACTPSGGEVVDWPD